MKESIQVSRLKTRIWILWIALIIAVVCLVVILLFDSSKPNSIYLLGFRDERIDYTKPITVGDAMDMDNSYENRIIKIRTRYQNGKEKVSADLQGFNIELANIRELLDLTNTQKLYIHLVYNPDPGRTTFLIMGVDMQKRIVMRTDTNWLPFLFEYCEPCPPSCPENLSDFFIVPPIDSVQ